MKDGVTCSVRKLSLPLSSACCCSLFPRPVSYTHLVASVKLITDRETRRSKGFAFIEMPDDAEAAKAIEQLNGAESVSYTHLDVYKRQGFLRRKT